MLFDNVSFNYNHLGFIDCSINGGVKAEDTSGCYFCLYLGEGDELPEESESSGRRPTQLIRLNPKARDNFVNLSEKGEKLFLGSLWSGQSLYRTPYSDKVCLVSYYYNDYQSSWSYRTASATLQAGTTISLKAYQLNFS